MPKIIAVADLHGYLPQDIPKCDILVIAGDICPHFDKHVNTPKDVAGQVAWLQNIVQPWLLKQPARHIVAIWGNHDFVGEEKYMPAPELPWYLLGGGAAQSEVVLEGLRFYGTPYTPEFYNWAFMEPEGVLYKRLQALPEGIDVMVSHGPPMWCCDRSGPGMNHVGSEALYQRIREMSQAPKDLICGHIHGGRGWGRVEQKTTIWNVAGVDETYTPHKPMWTEINIDA